MRNFMEPKKMSKKFLKYHVSLIDIIINDKDRANLSIKTSHIIESKFPPPYFRKVFGVFVWFL